MVSVSLNCGNKLLVLGQDRPPQVLVALAVAALAYYFYNTALRVRIFGGDQRQDPNRPNNGNQDHPDIPWYTRDDAGVAGEVARFFVPLCLSLFPGWSFPDNIPDRSQPQQPQQPQQEGAVEGQ